MFSFFKKKAKFSVRVREYEIPCYIAGMETITQKQSFRKDIAKFQKIFYEKRTKLKDRSSPRGTMVIYGNPDDTGTFSYYIGDWVDNMNQDSSFVLKTLEPGPYAHITVDFSVPNDLAISIAKAKNYFYKTWLPNSEYELIGLVESIELYDRRSEIQLSSIDLVFPLKYK